MFEPPALLSKLAPVVVQQPTESLMSLDLTIADGPSRWLNEFIPDSLMRPFLEDVQVRATRWRR